MEADVGLGFTMSGDNQDSDYAGDNRTLEFSRSNNDAGEGYTASAAAALDATTLGDPELRTTVIGEAASVVAKHAAVRSALLDFQRTYNEEWIIQRHGYRPPAQVRREQTTIMQTAA